MIESVHSTWQQIRSWLIRPGVQEGLIIAFLIAVLAIGGEAILGSGRYIAAAAVLIGAVCLMLFDLRIALLLLLLFFGAYEEFNLSSHEAFYAEGGSTSILTVRIFGIGILDFIQLFFAIPVLIKAWYDKHTKGTPFFRPYDMFMLPILLLWLYGVVMGLFHMHTIRAFTSDVRDLGHILLFYYTVTRIFTKPHEYYIALCVLLGTVFLKTFVFIARRVMGGGYVYGSEFTRTMLGSDTALAGALLASLVAIMFIFNSMPRKYKLGLLLLIFYIAMIVVSGLTRSTYLFTSIAILFLFVVYRRRIHISTFLITVAIVVSGALFLYFVVLSETIQDLIAYSLSSAFNWVDAIKTYGDMSLGQRVLETINIWETLARQGMLFLGLGWGGAWTEVAYHHPLDIGAFPLPEQMAGVHTSAHVDALQFMLKLGVIGVVLLYLFLFRYVRLGMKFLRRLDDPKMQWTLLTYILMVLIFVGNFIYFDRLKFLLALCFAGISVISYTQSRHERNSSGIAHSDDA